MQEVSDNEVKQFQEKRKLRDPYIITLIILLYTIIFSLLYYTRFLNFFTSNWDLGIEMQMLYSTGHGLLLYEAGDFETYGVLSQLEIHSTYLAVPVAYAFQYFHTVLFLYFLQAFFISIAIVPLWYLSAGLGLSRRNSYLLIAVYLLNFPLIASSFYDFHWMSVMPFLLFSLLMTVQKKHFLWSLLIIVSGTLVLEVFPFLAMGILLYSYLERSGYRLKGIFSGLPSRENFQLYGLLAAGVVSYVAVRFLQTHYIPVLLDNTAGIANVEKYFIQPLYPSGFSPAGTGDALMYWLFLYSAFAFIPFLYPKHLIIAVPWLYESIVLMPRYAGIADQYNFLAIPALVIGLAFGLRRIEGFRSKKLVTAMPFAALIASFAVLASNGMTMKYATQLGLIAMIIAAIAVSAVLFYVLFLSGNKGKARRVFTRLATSIPLLIAVLLVFNFAMGPMNTLNDSSSVDSGYAFSYSHNQEYPAVMSLVSMIPGNSTVITSDNLFPYVSSNNHSLSFYWENVSALEFDPYMNFSNGISAQYVLVDQSQYSLIPYAVKTQLNNSADYGLYAEVLTSLSYPGNVYLYRYHFSGTPRTISS